MTEQLHAAITNAVQNLHADAFDISLPDTIDDQISEEAPFNLSLSWKADGDLQLGHFLAWVGPANNSHETRVLEALSHTEIPVPQLVTAGTDSGRSIMLAAQVEGRSMASSLERIGMRWEISTLAFAYARMLARIHALDWTKVTPWLGDPESIPEDIVDDQVEAAFQQRSVLVETVPGDWRAFVERVIDWLELRRPVEASLCLCHGRYHPANLISVGEDVTAVVNWQHSRVTDASIDLAMLPVWLNDIGLSEEDAELFAQAAHGAYLQASPRGMGNTPYYSVALPLDALLDRLADESRPATETELGALQGTIERAMALAGRVPWKNR